MQHLALIALVVKDYDEAIHFFTQKLKFTLVEDTSISKEKRWVVIAPPGSKGCNILLAKAVGEKQEFSIGNQTGGRVFLFLHTDQFEADYNNLIEQEIKIIRTPTHEAYGTVAVFEDLYGNWWDLIEPTTSI